MGKISVVINTINEEKNIKRAIDSVKKIADEIVVVDMESSDKTVKIAKENGAEVYQHKNVNYVEPARNFAISKAKFEWVLILDADEVIPKTLSKKLVELSSKSEADYYRIPRKNMVLGKWMRHSRWWPDYNIRFFRKGYVSWNETIHSVPVTTGVGLDIPDNEDFAITHYHYQSIEEYINKMNRYSSLQADNLLESGYEFTKSDVIKKPVNEFLSRYFFGEGYRDGFHGFAMCTLQAFSEFVVYLKIWQKKKENKDLDNFSLLEVITEMKKSLKDFYYWKADAIYKSEGGLINVIKRKFRLP